MEGNPNNLVEINRLLAEKVALLEDVNRLRNKRKSSKNKSTKKPAKKAKAKEKKTPRRPTKRRAAEAGRAIIVRNPATGNDLCISSEKGKRNRAFRKYIKKASDEGFRQGGHYTELLVEILSSAYKHDPPVTWFNEKLIPLKVQRWAAKHSGLDIEFTSSEGESCNEDRPTETENWQGLFKKVHIPMKPPRYGKGFQEDLSGVQNVIVSQLHKVRQELDAAPFKFYLDYTFVMARGAYIVTEGETFRGGGSDEEQSFTISSASRNEGTEKVRQLWCSFSTPPLSFMSLIGRSWGERWMARQADRTCRSSNWPTARAGCPWRSTS
jgi:hypothetical protein